MKTRQIWVWSALFGAIVAVLLYISIFSKQSDSAAANLNGAKTSENGSGRQDGEGNAAKVDEERQTKREISNKMLEVAEGKRAISLKAELAPGVSGYVEPGAKVDIIAYDMTKDEKTNKQYIGSELVLQNVKVLASGKSVDKGAEALRYETITVEVTPEEGVLLSLAAKEKNGFYFMLRNGKDDGFKQNTHIQREIVKEGGSS
ncbi:RcpC/CpaB family pilus assembly protein [Ectobacillus ponti]|uniref:RcpC/CpaB family pilus assembly protein n=1 Tax=Ectobacillus ponti TaxID=2961894 RepID=A0AA42BRB8_9BACI|nr:RcpC/CpaB family pilus assembly protein [Ectobacillus ponti]MCP8969324.1 RcpC/CpaB family pilus assembly protein [Ectobacillus ponti]